jgi:Multicopper oxidase
MNMKTMMITPRVGRIYKKALLVEYTDASFLTKRPRSREEAHLGIQGPTLRAEVGDLIRVTFRNNMSPTAVATGVGTNGLEFSLHPHGVLYERKHEGAAYLHNSSHPVSGKRRRAGTPDEKKAGAEGGDTEESNAREALAKAAQQHRRLHVETRYMGDSVPPGATHVYEWEVPERAGPGPADGSSVAWFYHSHVVEPADVNAGLFGAIIVTARGQGQMRNGVLGPVPRDVDRELVVVFAIGDENLSPFALQNMLPLVDFDIEAMRYLSANMMFQDSNRMKAINGRCYANLGGLFFHQGDRVRWYVGTLGGELDIHGAHWHGNTLIHDSRRVDTIPLLPAVMTVADMVPDNPGQWMFHCHTNHHLHGGMTALYEVLPPRSVNSTGGSPTNEVHADGISTAGGSTSVAWVVAGSLLAFALTVVLALFAWNAARGSRSTERVRSDLSSTSSEQSQHSS